MNRWSLLIPIALAGCAVNEPPSPPVFHVDPAAPDTTSEVRVVIDEPALDLEGDAVTYHYSWSTNGIVLSEEDVLDPQFTSRDQVWKVEVVTADDRGSSSPAFSASFQIANAPPTVVATISPPAPTSADDLECVADAEDPDGDSLQVTYHWLVNAADAGDDAALPHGAFRRGDVVTCEVQASDLRAESHSSESSVVIADTPPVVDRVDVSPATASRGVALTASAQTSDIDGDPVSVAYAWKVDGTLVGEGDSLSGDAFSRGDVVVVEATPDDGALTGSTVESSPATIVNAPPVIDGVTLSPSSPEVGDVVTATIGTTDDPDGDTVTVKLAWTRNGTLLTGSGSTYPGGALSRGDVIGVVATPFDGTDEGVAATDSVVVDDNPPSVASASLSTSDIYEDTTVSCVAGTTADPDGDTVTVKTEWLVNGSVVSSKSKLDGTSFAKGDTVLCRLTPNDGLISGPSVDSAAAVVLNTPPEAPSVSVTPASASKGDTLTCSVDVPSYDADGDSVSYSYEWTLDGASLASGASVVAATEGLYACEVIPDDGADVGPSGSATAKVASWTYSGSVESAADATITGIGTNFGYPMSTGDYDGDGTPDLIVGSITSTYAVYGAYVFLGPLTSKYSSAADRTLKMGASGDLAGKALAALDLDGDGKVEVVIGAEDDDTGATNGGCIYVVPGGSASTTSSGAAKIYGTTVNGWFGEHMGAVGDLDGDGYPDLATTDYASSVGHVWILNGGSTPTGTATISSIYDEEVTAGSSLVMELDSFAVDFDGDGYDDLVTAEDRYSRTVYVLPGPLSVATSTSDAVTTFTDDVSSLSGFGGAFVGGDFDGDGATDLAVSNSYDSTFVWSAPTTGSHVVSAGADVTITSLTASGIAAGDVDGDGVDDLALGDEMTGSVSTTGVMYLFFGGALSGSVSTADASVTMTTSTSGAYLGYPVRLSDMDGDGHEDVLVSAYAGLKGYGRVFEILAP